MASSKGQLGFGLRLTTALLGAFVIALGIIALCVLIWSVLTGISVLTADWSNPNVWFFAAIKGTLIAASYWIFSIAMKGGTALLRQANSDEYTELMAAIENADIGKVQSLFKEGANPLEKRAPKDVKSALDLANSEFLIATDPERIKNLESIVETLKQADRRAA